MITNDLFINLMLNKLQHIRKRLKDEGRRALLLCQGDESHLEASLCISLLLLLEKLDQAKAVANPDEEEWEQLEEDSSEAGKRK